MTVGGLFVGLATLDVVQLVDGLPGPNQKTTARQGWLAAGGPAAVAAITFAALGGSARLWTALGGSAAARLAADDLAGAGVEVVDVAPPGFELAVSTAFVDADTGERAVVSGSAQAPRLGKIAGPDLSGVQVVLVDGHHPALARSAVLAAVGAPGEPRASSLPPVPEEPRDTSGVTKGRFPVVVDAGSHKPVFEELFGLVSDVICSADYTHPDGLEPRQILALGPELVAVSHGAEPLEWWSGGDSGRVEPTVMGVVDTLGAGDVLHGAYAYWLASGLDRPAALRRAVGAASERVRHLGPLAWRTRLA